MMSKPSITIKRPKTPKGFHSISSEVSPSKLSSMEQFEDGTHDIITLAPELDAKIAKVLGEGESRSTFNIIQSVNEIFPTEDSINEADEVLKRIKGRIDSLDGELRQLVQVKSTEKETVGLINQIKAEIKDLINTVQIIKQKATQCENTVLEITRDIKSLDGTKKNLSACMSLLKRVHLSVNALEYIKGLMNRKQYVNVADVLRALLQVAAPLQSYKQNQQLSSLCDRIAAFQDDAKKAIFQDFESAFNGGTVSMQVTTLHDGCLVLELLKNNAKNALMKWYIEMILADYRGLFQKNPEIAGLADISRRYAWMKRNLKNFDEHHAAIFPEHWKVAESFSWQFCQETKKDLAEVILKSERDGSFDTRTMLAAIQTTIEFESKIKFRFVTQGRDKSEIPAEEADKFNRIISSVFDSFLWHYIDMEDQVMSEKFDGFRRNLGEIEDGVFTSSFDLFLFYRQTFGNCAKLSTGKPFLDLCKMYQKWLVKYKDLLITKLPKDDRKIPSDDELIAICAVISTSDYCGATSGQLEEKLTDTINKEFSSLVSFTAEIEGFSTTTGMALVALVRSVENTLDAALIAMTRKSWGTIASVGDQSDHISSIGQTLSTIIPVIRKQFISPKFFKTLCDKFVESFLAKFLNTIYTRCKPLSEVGAEQMLLDTHSLNNILVAMTMIGAEEKSQPPASFMKILAKGISKIDQLLKVVMRPHDQADIIVETYLMLFNDHSALGFQKILELKGIKRAEIPQILDIYVSKAKIDTHESGDSSNIGSKTKGFMGFYNSNVK